MGDRIDTTNKSSRSTPLGEQLAQAMAELRAIMASGKSPTTVSGKNPRRKETSKKSRILKNTSKAFPRRTRL
jgi:hypothetical protein